jgi:hypothetical protein
VSALLLPLLARSALAVPATVVAGTTCEGAAVDTFRVVGVGAVSHCGG